MNLQYMSDSNGVPTGVFIPINEWNLLKEKYTDIEGLAEKGIPEWHKKIIDQRLEEYKNGEVELIDYKTVLDELSKS